MNPIRSLSLVLVVVIFSAGLAGCGGNSEQGPATVSSSEPTYVGAAVCSDCHQAQAALWLGSHHELAMQLANEATILGAFDDTEFIHNGVTRRFFKRDGEYFVETEGQSGRRALKDKLVSPITCPLKAQA